jgi:signal transduction histidine kinase
MLVRARRQLVVSLRDRARRAEAEQHLRVDQARQTERTRIAREMHDVLAHRISLVSVHAGALEFRADIPAEDVARSAAVIRENAHQALQDLREILGVLRAPDGTQDGQDSPERPTPTLADVPRLVQESQQAGMRVDLTMLVEPAEVPAATGRTAYRVVQEGLTNAHKHASGARVGVTLSGGPGEGLDVAVHNVRPVGDVPSPIPGAGRGLAGLAERVEVAGGRLEHGPDGAGWRLRVWLPWSR